MSDQPLPSVIGIDGGGTHCRFALTHSGHRFDVTLAAANASTDPEGTLATLKQGLAALAKAADVPLATLAQVPAYLGLAGVMDAQMGAEIARALPLHRAVVGDDRRTAMVGALGDADGCVIGIGTGSFMGRRTGGVDRLIGGWGFVLGDDASGAVLGRQALRCVLDVHDGLRAATPLTRALSARVGSPADIVAFASRAKPSDFAALAPDITAAAQEGDPVALTLMQEGARHIDHRLRHLGWQHPERICPLGGLATHYAPYLSPDLAAQLAAPAGTALDGALALAAQMDPAR
ncbi:ATPase [Rhodobacteraceae bacterium N5(2021)]|uniref:ATPase n=1 Tax=Gymnodinialimonas phycosphaerae TaxID=2841589 RepID=A0A975TVB9_9RHOB|nr:BadF/BadG/BcrA/BcrD ATPase family protein [Gymnodinialimonas phycosphaerae]MBY4891248.1 ATPase [Gymnodinialimonas phycosphaerae]